MFKYSNTNKRYHTFSYELKQLFNKKIVKISLDASLSCPNIDGKKGFGGCTYCSEFGSGDFVIEKQSDIKTQLEKGIEKSKSKHSNAQYIAYFQAHSNTYAPLKTLKNLFETALNFDGIVGLSIATRADCLEDDVLEYLSELNKRTYLVVELGLQTIFDKTAENINRCHTYAEFIIGFEKLKKLNIKTCIHIINGLPYETADMMLETAKAINSLNPYSIKIHSLHILKNTRLALQFAKENFDMLNLSNYVNIVCDQIELINPEIVIERITGDGDKANLVAPLWSANKLNVMNSIDKELAKRDSYQGKFCV
ncbi:MAG: TIGR01212 family radical SAM protein [Oscillospiraceae bacterium]